MKHLQITLTALLLISSMALSSCAKKNSPAPGQHQKHNCDQKQESTSKSST